jgi:hypothetical protein
VLAAPGPALLTAFHTAMIAGVPAPVSRLNDYQRAPQKGPVAIDRRGKFHVDWQQRSFSPLPSKQRQTQSSGCAKPYEKPLRGPGGSPHDRAGI